MAKDKEKLFKGIDDKAITFQRAVFIVCNLKRLIKRPKKDDKQTNASGSRKRSGADEEDGGEQRGGTSGSRRKANRLKEPVRRAFTLPTMLCGTLGLVAQTKASQLSSGQTQQQQHSPSKSGTEVEQQLDIGCGVEVPGEEFWRSAAIEAASAPNKGGRLKWAPTSSASGTRQSGQLGAPTNELTIAAASELGSSMINSMSSLSCLVTPIRRATNTSNQNSFNSIGLNQSTDTSNSSTTTLHNNNNSGSNIHSDLFVNQNELLPVIADLERRNSSKRRSTTSQQNQFEHQQQQQLWCPVWLQLMNELDSRQGQPREQAQFNHLISPPSSLNYLLAPEATILSNEKAEQEDNSTVKPKVLVSCQISTSDSNSEQLQTNNSSRQQRLSVEQQNRRISGFGSSLGLNTSGFEETNELVQDEEEDDDNEEVDDNDNDNEEEDDGCNLIDREEEILEAKSWIPSSALSSSLHNYRRSSNESAENRHNKSADSSKWHLHNQHTNKLQDHSRGPEVGGCSTSRLEEDLTHSTSSNSNVGSSTTTKRRQKKKCFKNNENQKSGQKNQLGPLDQMRMKRFSSALCLADQHQHQSSKCKNSNLNSHQSKPQAGLLSASGSRRSASPRRGTTSGSGGSGTGGGGGGVELTGGSNSFSKNQLSLKAQDPMVLARQRRPSASNQGAVNVDQQALFSAVECNQLERAKTILEDGKVNVNSLNGDKLTCLDIAVLMRNLDMIRLLQQHNAKESSAYLNREGRANQLYALYTEAKRLVEDLSRSIAAVGGIPTATTSSFNQSAQVFAGSMQSDSLTTSNNQNGALMLATGSLLSSALLEEKQRQLQYWRRRLDLFMHMRYEFERLEVPSAPELLVLQVVGETSLGVKIVHSLKSKSHQNHHHHHHHHQPEVLSQLQQSNQSFATGNSLTALASRCSRGTKCSHWQVLDQHPAVSSEHQQQQQQQQNDCLSSTRPFVQFHPNILESDLNESGWLSAAEKQQALIKQQKLLVFNQLLAQQLKLLSRQQRGAFGITPNTATATTSGSGSGCSQLPFSSVGQHQQQQQQLSKTNQFDHQTASGQRHHDNRIILAQSSSTDSESLGSRQSCGDVSGDLPLGLMNCAGSGGALGQGDHLLDGSGHCPSLAYQLMTQASKSHANAGRGISDRHNKLAFVQSGKELVSEERQRCSDCLTSSGIYSGCCGSFIITKYKVEWSYNEQMEPILSSMIVYNTNLYPLECQINGLTNGKLYYVRVAAGNHKGFSESRPTSPICLSPSSWRQVDGNKRRRCDEEVFRKFTKLILLNKHILDDRSSTSSLMAFDLSNSGAKNSLSASTSGGSGHTTSAGSTLVSTSQNKSSLINMLLLDATIPTGNQLIQEHRLAAQDEFQAQQQQQSNQTSMRKNLKNFFQSNSFKFHKLNNQNKRGLYLTTVIYYSPGKGNSELTAGRQQSRNSTAAAANSNSNRTQQQSSMTTVMSTNDKIVVTNDDRLPIIEVVNDVVSPAALMSDFYWLLKINGTQWMDIKRLRQQLQKSHSSSTLHLRIKLLTAIEQMQVALNIEDIGRLFYKPIQAHDGSIVICTCKQVANTKMVSNLSIKWTHQHKIIPRHLRKISDSMLSDQQNQQQREQRDWATQTSTRTRHRTESTSVVLAAHQGLTQLISVSTSGSGSGSFSVAAEQQQQSALSASIGQVASTTAALGVVAGNSAAASGLKDQNIVDLTRGQQQEFRLCEHCQHMLVQRRSTMASASSNSSLASSGDSSQWSSSGLSMSSTGQQYRCSCGRSSSSITTSTATTATTTATGISNLLSAPSSQRNSTSTQARSGSMISGVSGCYNNNNNRDSVVSNSNLSRQSQAQHLTSAQKSSTYLMLASLSLYDLLLFTMNEIIHFDRSSTVPLTRGLYLGFVQLQTTVESMRLLVPRNRPNMVPCARVRDNAHVSREEWQLLKRFAAYSGPTMQTTMINNNNNNNNSSDAHETTPTPGHYQEDHERRKPSASFTTSPSGNKPETANNDHLKAVSQPRLRATSVSPGLLNQSATSNSSNTQRDSLSLSSEQIVVGQSTGTTGNTKANYSDSDLRTGEHNNNDNNHHHQIVANESNCLEIASTGSGATKELNLSEMSNTSDLNLESKYTCDSISQKSYSRLPSSSNQSDQGSSSTQIKTPRRGSRSPTAASRITVNSITSGLVQSPEETFVRLVGSAARRLLAELRSQLPKVPANDTSLASSSCSSSSSGGQANDYINKSGEMSILQSLNDDENNRIYHVELIELSSQVTFILLIPSAENVCPVTSQEKSNILGDNKEYMLLPLQIFETIHISTYEPDLLGKYSRLSAILETDLIVAQHDHRQAFSSNELKSTKSRVSHLQDMVSIADEFWRGLRWIVDVVSFARDKSTTSANGGIKLGTIWRYFELSPSTSIYDHHSINYWPHNHQAAASGGNISSSQHPSLKPNQSQQRTGYEVKRTTSARATTTSMHSNMEDNSGMAPSIHLVGGGSGGEYRRTSGAVTRDNVPEIHLTQSSNSDQAGFSKKSPPKQRISYNPNEQQQQQQQQQWNRRHSGGDVKRVSSCKTGVTSGLGQQQRQQEHCEMVNAEEALVELKLGRDSSEDEEAIYAYHISLRDATRAAAQRKSSQQSTRPIVDEEPASPTILVPPPKTTSTMELCNRTNTTTTTTETTSTESAASRQLHKNPAEAAIDRRCQRDQVVELEKVGSHSTMMEEEKPRVLYLNEQSCSFTKTTTTTTKQLEGSLGHLEQDNSGGVLADKFIQRYKYDKHQNVESKSGDVGNRNMDLDQVVWDSSISSVNATNIGGEAKFVACKLLDCDKKVSAGISGGGNNNNNKTLDSAGNSGRSGNRKRHLKATNPFLSDSFDLAQN